MAEFGNDSNVFMDNADIIDVHPWQNSTIEQQNDANKPICITISPSQFRSLLSWRPSAVEFARLIILFVLRHIHSSQILILIADEIQKYNITVFEHKNEQRSLEIAIRQGQQIAGLFAQAYKQLSLNDDQRIQIICWKDILNSSDNYDSRVNDIRKYVGNNSSECQTLINRVRYTCPASGKIDYLTLDLPRHGFVFVQILMV